MIRHPRVGLALLCGILAAVVRAEDPMPSFEELHARAIANWPAPLLWAPSVTMLSSDDTINPKSTTFPTSPLPFIGISPCRLADTRDSTKPPGYGPPALTAGAPRNFTVTGQCGIAAEAAAVSLNITAVNTLGTGYILVFPQGGPFAGVSTLNYVAGQTVANAAIVPVGNSGGITVVAGVSGTDLIIDVNGYYANDLTTENGQFTLTSDKGGPALVVDNSDTTGLSGAAAFFGSSCVAGSYGAFGQSGTGSGCGAAYGFHGLSLSSADGSAGVLGEAQGGTTTNIFGVKGVTTSTQPDAAGVKGVGGWGDPLLDTGDCSPCWGAGVRGVNIGTSSTPAFGVLGISESLGVGGIVLDNTLAPRAYAYLGYSFSGTYYGVFSAGDFGGTGAKYFVEPHPQDPSKIIRYVALEGPEAGTYFRGTSETHGGRAIIDVPETFRQVTEQEGLTVQVTPVGELATFAVISADLDHIVVQSSKDVHFYYQVNGVRHGYADFDPVSTSSVFAPKKQDEKIPAYLNDAEKRAVISNGTYNADGTVNLETAKAQGWDQKWQVPPR